jgi:hypothetical protein
MGQVFNDCRLDTLNFFDISCQNPRSVFVFSLITMLPLRQTLQRELLPFVIALVIAQLYFKWGSFALELVGFIATWLVLGFLVNAVLRDNGKDM